MIPISDPQDPRLNAGNVCILFSATWCGPCRMIKPAMEKCASANKDLFELYYADVDEAQALATKYGVRAVPTAVILNNGEVKDVMQGSQIMPSALTAAFR